MPTPQELREVSDAAARAKRDRKAKEEAVEKARKQHEAMEALPDLIAEVEERMKEAAAQGLSSAQLYSYTDYRYGRRNTYKDYYLADHFRKQGYTINCGIDKPYGSDPISDYDTIWATVSW